MAEFGRRVNKKTFWGAIAKISLKILCIKKILKKKGEELNPHLPYQVCVSAT